MIGKCSNTEFDRYRQVHFFPLFGQPDDISATSPYTPCKVGGGLVRYYCISPKKIYLYIHLPSCEYVGAKVMGNSYRQFLFCLHRELEVL